MLGDGFVALPAITTEIERALDGADVAMVCLPALAHEAAFAELARAGVEVPVVLNPGHTCGALHAATRFGGAVAELSTLTYVARRGDDGVNVTGLAKRVRAAALPGGREALDAALSLYPCAVAERDSLHCIELLQELECDELANPVDDTNVPFCEFCPPPGES